MGSLYAGGIGLAGAVGGIITAVLLAVGASAASAAGPDASLDGSNTRTRFVIALDREASFQVSSLGEPNRVVVDLPDVRVGLPSHPGTAPIGLVKSFRGGLAAAGKYKVVIDVTSPVIVEKAVLQPAAAGVGPRLVLEIVPTTATKRGTVQAFNGARLGAAGLGAVQPPLPRPAAKPGERAARRYKPTIVLDPGHGGHDSGAQRHGAVEKDVVLAFSLVLRDRLTATGRYTVLMTRDADTFVPLDDRRDFAERNRAGLFMAIHADYAGANARGATIYSLRESVARDLKRSAVGEVARNVLTDKELQAIRGTQVADAGAVSGFLADLAQREVEATPSRTSMFARSVIEYLGESTNVMNNPDRSAAFRVLKTAKVPAVLLELAFVSNKQDAANLKSEAWRQKVAESIVTAIESYFSQQEARLPM